MDEDELEEYLRAIAGLQEQASEPESPVDQLRDEDGFRVDGCFRVRPTPTI